MLIYLLIRYRHGCFRKKPSVYTYTRYHAALMVGELQFANTQMDISEILRNTRLRLERYAHELN